MTSTQKVRSNVCVRLVIVRTLRGAVIKSKRMNSEAQLGTPGPFEVRLEPSSPFFSASDKTHETLGSPAQGSVDSEPAAPLHVTRQTDEVPRRRYECSNYEICLGLAASLNWESFTCRGCSGATNQNLLWRARLTARKDTVAAKLLRAEPITPLTSPTPSAKRHSSVSVP